MHASVQSVTDQGSSPVVRIAGLENWMVKRALDTGATAIMCPMVGNAVRSNFFFHPHSKIQQELIIFWSS